MLIMIPILALKALDHELVDVIEGMRFVAVTVAIKECLVVMVPFVFIVLFVTIELARERHSPVATITSEV